MYQHKPVAIKAVLGGLLVATAICALLGLKLPVARAAGTVTNCASYGPGAGTLQNALSGGGVITFTCSGTIIVPEIFIDMDTTLDATGQTVILSGNNANPILHISQLTVQIIHLSIMNGQYVSNSTHGSAGIYNQGGNLTITDSIIAQNTLTTINNYQGLGGGLTTEGGTVTITGSQFYNNSTVNGEGGAIHNSNGTVSINNTTISNNQATSNNTIGGYGGGVTNREGQMTLNNVTMSNNSARSGGGIENVYFSNMTVSNSTLSGNSVIGAGGAIWNFGSMTVNNSLFNGNTAVVEGGGIWNGISNSVFLTISSSSFSNNSVTGANQYPYRTGFGGAISNNDTMDISTSTFSGNTATDGGRAIWYYGRSTRVVCSNIAGNGGTAPYSLEGYQLGPGAPIADVRNNWWGDASGPSGAGPGTGDPVSNGANFSGFLAGPATVADCPPPLATPTPILTNIPDEAAIAVPVCSDLNSQINTIVRAQLRPGVFDIHCRIIAENHHFIRTPAEIGVQSVLDKDVIHAVDIFSPSNENAAGSQICLQGSGSMVFLDAIGVPRVPQSLITTIQGDYTCATIPDVGTLVLVGDMTTPNSLPDQNTVIGDCRVTTTHQVNLRREPNTSSVIITVLPFQLTLKANARSNGFFKVIYLDGQGWVSGNYVTLQGSCGS